MSFSLGNIKMNDRRTHMHKVVFLKLIFAACNDTCKYRKKCREVVFSRFGRGRKDSQLFTETHLHRRGISKYGYVRSISHTSPTCGKCRYIASNLVKTISISAYVARAVSSRGLGGNERMKFTNFPNINRKHESV